ncbi:hypothetical protein ASM1NWU_75 [Enterococcus phage AS-M1_NWU]|nr:hypothetical protein ASM1NWU_75 [Enterococcus phage AS-M1_NWU]
MYSIFGIFRPKNGKMKIWKFTQKIRTPENRLNIERFSV